MKRTTTLLAALALSALLVFVASVTTVVARGQSGDGRAVDTVTKTLNLTLNGRVPEGTGFSATARHAGGEVSVIYCGKIGTQGGAQPCAGGGRRYWASAEFVAGTTITVTYRREGGGESEVFYEKIETLTADMVNDVSYTFGGDHAKEIPRLPDTGAGGLSGAPPPGYHAAALLLLTAGAYPLLRRW